MSHLPPTVKLITGSAISLGMVASLRRFSLAWLRADRGALDAVRAVAAQLRDHGELHHNSVDEGRGRWVLVEVLRRMGDLDGADREIQAALGMTIPLEHPGALETLSALRLAQGHPAEALAIAEDAVARCTAMGGCGPFRGAFVRLAHAGALHATGAHDAAQAAIADARTCLLSIADRIADLDYRQSFLTRVPENAEPLALSCSWLGEPASDN